ncbi:T9SS type A sorting domain-containing protein [Postechiella marina]|uniref:T9SS type A sorting domain-containing protein n=1 Tax=Postechiella marina TaxID=943941 RepID=A0ABP8C3I4_9FLAO
MKKNYILITFLTLCFFVTQLGFAQSSYSNAPINDKIEKLSIYPNPVASGKPYIYITSKKNLTKSIEIYNVLGKKVYQTILTSKELNISKLNSGVYMLKITEDNIAETRKLIIK